MLHYVLRELAGRYKLYLLTVVVIALVTCMVITLNFISTAYKNAARLPFKDIHGSIIVQKNGNVPENISGVLLSCSLAPIHRDIVSQINNIQGADDISSALSLWVFDTDRFKRVIGVDWKDNFGKAVLDRVVEGQAPGSNTDILVDKTYAENNRMSVGQEEIIAGNRFTVSGIMRPAGNEIITADVYTNLQTAQDMAYRSANLQAVEEVDKTDVNIIIVNSSQQQLPSLSQKIRQALATPYQNGGQTPLGQNKGTYNIYSPDTFEDQISSILKLSDQMVWVISIVLFIGACLIVARNTLHLMLERKREFGILKSVGFRMRDIQKLVGLETSLQALAGFVAGLVLTGLAVLILSRTTVSIAIPWELTAYPHFLLANPEDANIVQTYLLPIKFDLSYIFITFAGVLLVGLVTTFLGIWQINRLRPVEVLKYE